MLFPTSVRNPSPSPVTARGRHSQRFFLRTRNEFLKVSNAPDHRPPSRADAGSESRVHGMRAIGTETFGGRSCAPVRWILYLSSFVPGQHQNKCSKQPTRAEAKGEQAPKPSAAFCPSEEGQPIYHQKRSTNKQDSRPARLRTLFVGVDIRESVSQNHQRGPALKDNSHKSHQQVKIFYRNFGHRGTPERRHSAMRRTRRSPETLSRSTRSLP